FELNIQGTPSALLIGKNGAGKSTIAIALEVLQRIGRGINRVGQLVGSKDFARGRSDVPIRFEIEVLLEDKLYKYVLALELPEKFRELRVFEEQLLVAGDPIYSKRSPSHSSHQLAKS
ncbi:MAG: AAA family ATPase, partial [Microcoleus sp.]